MTHFFDLSKWILQEWNKPQKGSRPNNIYENPETGELFYFKQSKANYPTEIWSEVVASKFGQMLGYNVLDYNIGVNGELYGCLSKSMVNKNEGEELYHGVDILNDNVADFEITDKPICSFQDWEFICSSNSFFETFIPYFVETVILDAIIGNTDRHTENWAFIRSLGVNMTHETFKFNIDWTKTFQTLLKFKPQLYLKSNIEIQIEHRFKFAPIYDSGSCLAREKDEKDIEAFLGNENQIKKYILNAKSEIRWNKEKCNLFELVKRVNSVYPKIVQAKLSLVFERI